MASRLARIGAHLKAAPTAGSAELLPPFSGTDVPVDSGYKWEPAKIAQLGLRASIRDADGQPTNCDGGKPWIGDIAATAAKGGMRPYAWYSPDEPPAFVPLGKPLRECTIGLVSTSGCYPIGQKGYQYKDDSTFRAIPSTTAVETLHFSHFTENYLTDARRDPSCVFPLETLRRLRAAGTIGALPENVFSVMGANYSTRTVQQKLAPAVVEAMAAEGVDAVLVVPM